MKRFIEGDDRDKNFTPHKLEERMKQIDESIERYMNELDTADRTQPVEAETKTQYLQEKLAKLKQSMEYLREIEKRLKEQPDGQLSLADLVQEADRCQRKVQGPFRVVRVSSSVAEADVQLAGTATVSNQPHY